MNKNILTEQINSNFKILKDKPTNVLKRIKGVVSDNRSNRNGRIYPIELWKNVVESDYVKEMIDNHSLFGEADHPETRLEISLQNVSHAINDLWIDGDKVMAVIDILPTPMGKILSELLDYGTNLGISSRGAGTVLSDNTVDPDDYQFVTFDFVARPSCEAARLNTILESATLEASNTKDDEINNLLESYKSELTEGTANKRIDYFGSFDNGHVIHRDWKKMTPEEAEEMARQASIDDPNHVYYVYNDDVMNPTTDSSWYKGEKHSFDDGYKISIELDNKNLEESNRVLSIEEVRKTLSDDDIEGLDLVLYDLYNKVDLEKDSLSTIEDLVHDSVFKYNDANVLPEYEGKEFYGREYNARNIYNAILKMYGRDKQVNKNLEESDNEYKFKNGDIVRIDLGGGDYSDEYKVIGYNTEDNTLYYIIKRLKDGYIQEVDEPNLISERDYENLDDEDIYESFSKIRDKYITESINEELSRAIVD